MWVSLSCCTKGIWSKKKTSILKENFLCADVSHIKVAQISNEIHVVNVRKVIDLLVNVKFESEEDTNYLCEVPNWMESDWFANQWILWTCYWSMEK